MSRSRDRKLIYLRYDVSSAIVKYYYARYTQTQPYNLSPKIHRLKPVTVKLLLKLRRGEIKLFVNTKEPNYTIELCNNYIAILNDSQNLGSPEFVVISKPHILDSEGIAESRTVAPNTVSTINPGEPPNFLINRCRGGFTDC